MKHTCPNCRTVKTGWKFLQCADCREHYQLSPGSEKFLLWYVSSFPIVCILISQYITRTSPDSENMIREVMIPIGVIIIVHLLGLAIYMSQFVSFVQREPN